MRGTARTTAVRLGAYVASSALVVSGAVLAATPAGAVAYDPQPKDQAATWLQDELTSGVVHNAQFDFDDIALTADFAFALDAIGGHATAVNDIVDTIEPRAHDEWYTSTFDGVTTTYAGSVAKLMVLVQKTGGTPSSFGGNNLRTLLEEHTSDTAPIAGRITNENDSFGDANVIGQAYAANALNTAGSTKASNATSFLLKQQCSSGYFRLAFNTDKGATNQSCVNGTDLPDTDATAIAVMQLASQSADSTVATAIARAKSWLKTQQRCDGSFGGGTSTEGSNANSSGLVAAAMGDSTTSRQAARFLRTLQATSADASNELAGEAGAIAYDKAARTAGQTAGITTNDRDQWRRATSQGGPGLNWYSTEATPNLSLTGPTGYLKQGTRAVLRTSGALPDTVLCLTGVGHSSRALAGSNATSTTVTLPNGTRSRVYTVRDAFGHANARVVKVLGAAKLSVTRSKFKVKRSHYVTATVSYLAPGEWARIYYKGAPVRSGHASSTGRFTATFKVGRALGKKTIAGYGQFTDIRRGAAVIKVVR
jgi:hypothetical protein